MFHIQHLSSTGMKIEKLDKARVCVLRLLCRHKINEGGVRGLER